MGFLDSVGGFFQRVTSGVTSTLGTVWDTGVGLVNNIIDIPKTAINAVRDVYQTGIQTIGGAVKDVSGAARDAVGSVASSLTLPLTALGVAAAAFILLKKPG